MMTKSMSRTIILLLLFPVGTQGFLDQLLDILFQPILNSGCTAITNLIGNVGNFNCACTGNFAIFQLAFTGNVNCATKTPICLAPTASYVCGDAEVKANFGAGLLSGSRINNAGACVKLNLASIQAFLGTILTVPQQIIDQILNAVLQNGPPSVCFEAQGNPNALTFATCSATVGQNKKCQTCTVCPDGQSFTIDCSNVDIFEVINPTAASVLPPYPGPQVTCIGLDLLQQ